MAEPTAEQLAGAAFFDATMQTMGAISGESFDRGGKEDRRAMVDALHAGLQSALGRGPDFRFGFLLPMADLMDSQRLGVLPDKDWSGVVLLRQVAAGRW